MREHCRPNFRERQRNEFTSISSTHCESLSSSHEPSANVAAPSSSCFEENYLDYFVILCADVLLRALRSAFPDGELQINWNSLFSRLDDSGILAFLVASFRFSGDKLRKVKLTDDARKGLRICVTASGMLSKWNFSFSFETFGFSI